MDIRFTYECQFMFPQLQTDANTKELYYIGLGAVVLFSLYAQFITGLRCRYLHYNGYKYLDLFLQFLILINIVVFMFLLMTNNAGVIITLILSHFLAYLITIKISYGKGLQNESEQSYLIKDESEQNA